ncbi:MAG: hypothetical protein QOF38_5078 [Pseudonocardiales bacterium]|nr:hypothetical protein [Pseudonocardiales bacterium]
MLTDSEDSEEIIERVAALDIGKAEGVRALGAVNCRFERDLQTPSCEARPDGRAVDQGVAMERIVERAAGLEVHKDVTVAGNTTRQESHCSPVRSEYSRSASWRWSPASGSRQCRPRRRSIRSKR